MRISVCSSDCCSSDLEGVVEFLAALGRAHHAVLEAAAFLVARAVQRQQLVLAEAGALLQHGVDQLAGRLRAAGQRGHLLLVVEQLVEQEADVVERRGVGDHLRSEEHTSELQSLMRISYAVFCLKKKKTKE